MKEATSQRGRGSAGAGLIARVGGALVLLGVVSRCGGPPAPPSGPAPEYERPEVAPWDAGLPPDPLSNLEELEGEWVDGPPDAAPQGLGDAAGLDGEAPDSDAGAPESREDGGPARHEDGGADAGP